MGRRHPQGREYFLIRGARSLRFLPLVSQGFEVPAVCRPEKIPEPSPEPSPGEPGEDDPEDDFPWASVHI